MVERVPSDRTLKAIVAAGVAAPSPDNNQPWLFHWDGRNLTLSLDLREALPSDVNHMFDLLSAGAVIENITLAAGRFGLRAEAKLLEQPPRDDSLPVAQITFESGSVTDPLAFAIPSRCTNRRPYSTQTLADSLIHKLTSSVEAIPGVSVVWVVDRKARSRLGRLIAMADRFRFEYPAFHAEIFRQLRFTSQQVETTRDGLDVRTLALPPGGKTIIRALRSWRVMNNLNRIGLSKLLTIPTILSVKRCGGLALLTVAKPSQENFIAAGRAMERLWLAATQAGLSVHPLGSLPIFLAHEAILHGQKLTPWHRALARWLAGRLAELLPGIHESTLALILRLGYAAPPKVRSLRRPVEAFLPDLAE